ncbi:MAG: o-succinylbenzoate synthase [Deltaproteobacteria bacterium]|nr:o-succinylbenzoate synthase [Deltaproteobacteria bacterium]
MAYNQRHDSTGLAAGSFKISAFKVFKFSLGLRQPLVIGEHHLSKRTGFIIEIRTEGDHVAFGEISPLPGLSREDMTLVETQIMWLRSSVLGRELPDHLEALSGGVDNWLRGYNLAPSVRFGFETAVLNLIATARGLPLCKLITNSPRDWISVNGLLSGSPAKIMQKAEKLLEMDYRAFKLKVGRNSIQEDIEITRHVRRFIGDDATLRLDANRAWSIDDALAFGQAVADCEIDYIEEPVKTLSLLEKLIGESGWLLPTGLDESLLELTAEGLLFMPGIKVVVLKPSLLGFEKAMQFARAATARGIMPVISSAFESSVGLTALAHLAACVNVVDVPVGLDTLDWFEEDLLVDPLRVEMGRLRITELPDIPHEIRRDLLEAI